eukprot:TRINITY_DN33875_c0_g1_i1.p1 TRINITY_DN33875_c0_g1~~TRINITY_DN33875_c0_g1_i1.p1  ORF type:complete len:247 (+),score=46.12 TRINITY_DN33875_c0_g1_i1:14-754(+)
MEELLRGAQEAPPVENKSRWSPYVDNAGTVIAIAGKDFVVVGGDTRLSLGYQILHRNESKILQLTSKCAIASSGMKTDIARLHKMLKHHITTYKQKYQEEPSTEALAQLLSNTLYYRRFFPYYTFNLLVGLKEDGTGGVYGYDAIGSYDKIMYGAQGSGQELLIPVLDSQLKGHNHLVPEYPTDSSFVTNMVKDVMNSCAERDIHTGDAVEIMVITKTGVTTVKEKLRSDQVVKIKANLHLQIVDN